VGLAATTNGTSLRSWLVGRFLLALVLLALCGGGSNLRTAWAAAGRPLNVRDNVLRVAVDASYPPLAAVGADGELWGLEVDLSRTLAQRLGLELELRNTDVGGGLDALIGDQYDAILAGLSRSADLEDRVAFSRPYFDDGPRGGGPGAPPPH
jgi:putative lysine/arginine/ornithine/histidine/octopine transport system substrate-binding protein